MSKPTTLKCAPCFAAYQEHKGMKKEGNPPKVRDAGFVYSGNSMCQSHFVAMVNLQMTQLRAQQEKEESLIEVPGLRAR